jgi:phosphate starvation-inducible membrane PsiE
MKRIQRNKKGSIADMVITFTFLLILVVVGSVSLFIYTEFNDAWQAADTVNDASKEALEDQYNLYERVLDGLIVLMFVILWIISLISAFFLDSNPIFFVLFIIISIVSLIGIIAINQFIEPLQATAIGAALALMPISVFIVNNSIYFSVAYVLSVGAALYFKIGGRE